MALSWALLKVMALLWGLVGSSGCDQKSWLVQILP